MKYGVYNYPLRKQQAKRGKQAIQSFLQGDGDIEKNNGSRINNKLGEPVVIVQWNITQNIIKERLFGFELYLKTAGPGTYFYISSARQFPFAVSSSKFKA